MFVCVCVGLQTYPHVALGRLGQDGIADDLEQLDQLATVAVWGVRRKKL